MSDPFAPWLRRWNLRADGAAVTTHAARLLPVIRRDRKAMLKLSHEPDEILGTAVMEWWGGTGAAEVLARDGPALLIERATGTASLSAMARGGQDDRACRIICDAAARLHAPRGTPPADLIALDDWFRALWPAARTHGGILTRSAAAAGQLLADPREVRVLHGDLHHDNVLDFGPRGWLAIDPKGLIGERGFDFANIFTNPDLSDPTRPVATLPGRLERRLAVVTEAAVLEPRRLLRWILAWTGLSAAWFIADDDPLARIDLIIAECAAALLDG